MLKLPKDLREFIELLNSEKVEYLLIGGWSVGIHFRPRYTKDIDFFIRASKENAERMIAAISKLGFGSLGLTANDFCLQGNVIQLGIEPNRIDIVTSISGVDFDEAWKEKIVLEIDETPVFLISKPLLIRNKLESGRPQDLVDAENLKKAK